MLHWPILIVLANIALLNMMLSLELSSDNKLFHASYSLIALEFLCVLLDTVQRLTFDRIHELEPKSVLCLEVGKRNAQCFAQIQFSLLKP